MIIDYTRDLEQYEKYLNSFGPEVKHDQFSSNFLHNVAVLAFLKS